MTSDPTVPQGFWRNAQGGTTPLSKIKPQDQLEDELVRRLAQSAEALNATLSQFRDAALSEAAAFRELVRQDYGVNKGGKGGNMTLTSFDGSLRMQVSVSESLSFGPQLSAAKDLIDACVSRWSEGVNDNMRVLTDHAFQVNKQGRIDTHRVLGLRRLDITDAEWLRAMEAISDAVRVTSSKTYVRFYKVDPETSVQTNIALNIAAV